MAQDTATLKLVKPELSDNIELTIPALADNFDTIDTQLTQTNKKFLDVSTRLLFDSDDNRIEIDRTLEPKQAITIESNFILSENPKSYGRLVSKSYDGADITRTSFVLCFDSTGRKPRFSVMGLNGGFDITSPDSLESGTPHQVIGTWDKETGIAKLYVNGILKIQSTPFMEDIRYNTDQKLLIGASVNNSGNYSYVFLGEILKTRIWGEALTVEQVDKGHMKELVYDSSIALPHTFPGKVTYQKHDALLTRIQAFSDVEIIGKDSSGTYDMHAIHLGIKGKPVILMNGAMHGTEWQTTQYMMSFMEMLRDNIYPDTEFKDYLLSNYHLIFIPTLNPHGYDRVTNIYDQFNPSARSNANGVDLNDDFGNDKQTQQETQNLIRIVSKYQPFAYLDAHMFQGYYDVAYGNNLIVGHGHKEQENIRDVFADSWEEFAGQSVTRWLPVNGESSGLARAYVARQPNPYTPYTLAYITELCRPSDINGVRVAPLTDEQIYNYGIASLHFFIRTSLDYIEHYEKTLQHHWDFNDGVGDKIYDNVTKTYNGTLYGKPKWKGNTSRPSAILENKVNYLEKFIGNQSEHSPIGVSLTPNVLKKGTYYFYLSGSANSQLFQEYLTSIGITASQYNVPIENLRAIVKFTINSNNTGMQEFNLFDYATANSYELYGKFIRISNFGTFWGKWQEEVFVVEKGSNSNGEYIRYSDGVQKCWCNPISQITNQQAGALYQSVIETVTYPKSFSNMVRPTISVSGTGRWGNITLINMGSCEVRQFNINSSTTPISTYVYVEGKWR